MLREMFVEMPEEIARDSRARSHHRRKTLHTDLYGQLFASDAPASSAGIKECAAAVRAPVSRWVSLSGASMARGPRNQPPDLRNRDRPYPLTQSFNPRMDQPSSAGAGE
jgi:hypothetical protein